MTRAATVPGRTDTATRLILAPPAAVAASFARPDTLMAWLPPEGMTGRALAYDFREGGRYRIELVHSGEGAGKTSANTDISAGRFLALEPGRRIVMSVEFDSHDPGLAGEMIMTWTFEPAPGGTQVTIVAEHVPPAISAADHVEGLASSLENLARFVAPR